mgnify:CR=1 FL=1
MEGTFSLKADKKPTCQGKVLLLIVSNLIQDDETFPYKVQELNDFQTFSLCGGKPKNIFQLQDLLHYDF